MQVYNTDFYPNPLSSSGSVYSFVQRTLNGSCVSIAIAIREYQFCNKLLLCAPISKQQTKTNLCYGRWNVLRHSLSSSYKSWRQTLRKKHCTALWRWTNNTCCHAVRDIQVHNIVWPYLRPPKQYNHHNSNTLYNLRIHIFILFFVIVSGRFTFKFIRLFSLLLLTVYVMVLRIFPRYWCYPW